MRILSEIVFVSLFTFILSLPLQAYDMSKHAGKKGKGGHHGHGYGHA